jgi:hypothetical protein
VTHAGYLVQKILGFFALASFVLLLIALSSCACEPGVEYCGEPNMTGGAK